MVVDANWVELKTEDGRTYFWNRKENARAWALPEGTSVKWVGQKAQDGRTYYWSRDTKETVWVLPPLPDGKGAEASPSPPDAAPAAADGDQAVQADAAAQPDAQEDPPNGRCPDPEELEPAGPAGSGASAVAARHAIQRSGCDSWFVRTSEGDWEEVVRFWPPPKELMVKKPKLRRPKPDPYGFRNVLLRCQRHEEMVKALLAAQFGSLKKFSTAKYPTPMAVEWCFWTQEGDQFSLERGAPPKEADKVVRRSPPEGSRFRLLQSNLRTSYSLVYKARRLRRFERAVDKENKVVVQDMLDKLGSEGQLPETLTKRAQTLLAPPAAPPAKQPPTSVSKAGAAGGDAMEVVGSSPPPFVKGGAPPMLPLTMSQPAMGIAQTLSKGAGPPPALAPLAPGMPGIGLPGQPGPPAKMGPLLGMEPQAGAPLLKLSPTDGMVPFSLQMPPMPTEAPPQTKSSSFAKSLGGPPPKQPPALGVDAPAVGGELPVKGKGPPPAQPPTEVPAGGVENSAAPGISKSSSDGQSHLVAKQPPPQGLLIQAPPGLPGAPPGMPALGMPGMPTMVGGMPMLGAMTVPGMTMPTPGMMPTMQGMPGFKAPFPGTVLTDAAAGGLPPTKAPPSWKAPPATPADSGDAPPLPPPMKAAPPGLADMPVPKEAAPVPDMTQAQSKSPAVADVAAPTPVAASTAPATAEAAAVPAEAPWASRKRRRTSAAAAAVADAPAASSAPVAEPATATPAHAPAVPAPAPAAVPSKADGAAAADVPSKAMPTRKSLPQPATDSAAAQRIAAAAQRLAAATGAEASSGTAKPSRAGDLLVRKVTVSNIPAPAKTVELAEFFTGAIFSASGNGLAAQWQSGEASKVVVGVELLPGTPFGATAAEITFGTATGATVAVALHGIQFKDKALEIRRPKGFSQEKGKAGRANLQNISIKDLVAGGGSEAIDSKSAIGKSGGLAGAASGVGNETSSDDGSTSCVELSGIPSSMSSKSVFDLLQQFGGPLKRLNLVPGKDGAEHAGHGVAEYVDRTSAVEAQGFSPLLGFIEVKLGGAPQVVDTSVDTAPPLAKRQRKNRFDPTPEEPEEDDMGLGVFEAVLAQAGKTAPAAPMPLPKPGASLPKPASALPKPAPAATHALDVGLDLGPFEAVLPSAAKKPKSTPTVAKVADDLGPFEALFAETTDVPTAAPALAAVAQVGEEDLGPFEAVLPDLGPFEAVLPPTRAAPAEANAALAADPLEDLGPFAAVVSDRKPAASPVPKEEAPLDDLGPFAGAVQSFTITKPGPPGTRR